MINALLVPGAKCYAKHQEPGLIKASLQSSEVAVT